jgi:hypothetical protein
MLETGLSVWRFQVFLEERGELRSWSCRSIAKFLREEAEGEGEERNATAAEIYVGDERKKQPYV